MIKKIRLCLLSLTLLSGSIGAQSDFFKTPTFTISVFNHSIGVPFKDFFKTPLNGGVTMGVEFGNRENNTGKMIQRLEVGWYRHRHLNTAIWIKTDFIRRFRSKDGWYAEIQGGLGYIQDFKYYESFEKGADGKYAPARKKSKGGLLVDVGVGAGYQFDTKDKYSISPYFRYEGMVQFPYSKIIAFFPHSLLHVGTRHGIHN